MHIRGMKLDDFMRLKGISDDGMGKILSKDRTIVSKYRRGSVMPPLSVIALIEKETDGAVSFRDFLPREGEAA